MSSSFRSDLKSGYMKEWEEPLREAVNKINFVINEIWESDSDTSENIADDRMLASQLSNAKMFIENELPTQTSNDK